MVTGAPRIVIPTEAANNDAQGDRREAEFSRIESMLEAANRSAFACLRSAKEDISPTDIRLTLEVLDRITALAALRLEVMRERGAL